MNYQKIHDDLINKAKNRSLSGYYETHHIIPECMGGLNTDDNLVDLTPEEHFIVHQLLVKIYPNNYKLLHAAKMMCVNNDLQKRNNKLYGWLKKKLSSEKRPKEWGDKISKALKGNNHSQETRRRQSIAQKKRTDWKRGHKRPGVGGRKPGFKGIFRGSAESIAKMVKTKKITLGFTENTKDYKILTPSGFKSFAGVDYSGLVPCLQFTLSSSKTIIVSNKHRFETDKMAKEYIIGEFLTTIDGIEQITNIEPVGKKQVFDVIEVDDHLYIANNIVNHNCEFIVDANSVVIPEWKDEYIKEIHPDEYYGFYHRYDGMDLGVKDFTAAIFGYYDFRKATVVIEDELTLNGPSLTTLILKDQILAKEKQLWGDKPVYKRIADSNNPLLIQDLGNMHQLYFRATNKDSLEAMINEVRLMVQAGQVIIHPRCLKLIGCLKYAVWDNKGTSLARSTVYGHYDHLMALVYLIRNLDKHTNPIPITHGLNPYTHFITPDYGKKAVIPEGLQSLANLFPKPRLRK